MSETEMDEAERQRASGMDPRILEMLICPLTRQPLEYDGASDELISRKAGLAFPIRNGLPLLTEKHAREIEQDGP
ncbi:MAG: Trm112 family protein [Pseudomonadota bacterium]